MSLFTPIRTLSLTSRHHSASKSLFPIVSYFNSTVQHEISVVMKAECGATSKEFSPTIAYARSIFRRPTTFPRVFYAPPPSRKTTPAPPKADPKTDPRSGGQEPEPDPRRPRLPAAEVAAILFETILDLVLLYTLQLMAIGKQAEAHDPETRELAKWIRIHVFRAVF